MIQIEIPGRETLELKHLVCDYNGTLALDGKLLSGLPTLLETLSPPPPLSLAFTDVLPQYKLA